MTEKKSDEILKKYNEDLGALVEKYQEDIHAGLLLQNALHLFVKYTFECCNTNPEKAYEMIKDILDFHLKERQPRREVD
jgi:hypothetical protein